MPPDHRETRDVQAASRHRVRRKAVRSSPRLEGLEGRSLLDVGGFVEAVSGISYASPQVEIGSEAEAPVMVGPMAFPMAAAGNSGPEISPSVPLGAGNSQTAWQTATPAPAWVVTQLSRENVPNLAAAVRGDLQFEDWLTHPRPELAHWLPGDERITMLGSVRPGEIADLYAIPMGPDGLRLRYTAFDPESRLADSLLLLDENFQVIDGWSVLQHLNSLTIELRPGGVSPGSAVYLQVGPSGPSQGYRPEYYALNVEPGTSSFATPSAPDIDPPGRDSLGSNFQDETTADGGSQGTARITIPEPWLSAGGSLLDAASQAESATLEESAPSPVDAGTTLAGPLPARSAAPFGGILGFGDPTPPVDSHEAAVVDLALMDWPGGLSGWSPPIERQCGSSEEIESSGVVTWQTQDGFPQLGAAYLEVSLPESGRDPVNLVGLAHSLALQLHSREHDQELALETTAKTPASDVAESPSMSRRVMRWTVAGSTALMAAHLLMPDLGLVFSFARSRSSKRRWRLAGLGSTMFGRTRPFG